MKIEKINKPIFMVLVLYFSSFGFAANATQDKYKSLDGEEKFTEIKNQITNSALGVSKYKADDAYKEITSALNEIKRLHRLVNKATHVDEVIDNVADGLDKIATAYEKVASFKNNISDYRSDKFEYLEDINGETLQTEKQLKIKIQKIETENRLLQKKLTSALDDIEKQTVEISLKGNESIINSLEAQCLIWEKFHVAQDKLLESLQLNGRKIDLLLHVLDVNAKVYREAANVARLRRSAKGALDNLRSLADIQSIIGDLQESWIEVNDIVTEISKAEFLIDIQ